MQEPRNPFHGCDICASHDNLSEWETPSGTVYLLCIKHRLSVEARYAKRAGAA